MRVTALQFAAGSDVAANQASVAQLVAQACAAGAPDLVSLPEMWSCLGGDRATKQAAAVALPPAAGTSAHTSGLYAFMAQLAAQFTITLHGGSIGEIADGVLYNTSLVFGPDGRELGRYRKIHLFDIVTPSGAGYRESALFGAGSDVVVCDTPTGRLGLAICYDLRFPELFLALRRAGADVIMLPAAFTAETGRDHWQPLLQARAIETQTPVVAAATCGTHADGAGNARETWGHAMIIDAWGNIRAQLANAPGNACADLDPAHAAHVRAAMPLLAHRRLA